MRSLELATTQEFAIRKLREAIHPHDRPLFPNYEPLLFGVLEDSGSFTVDLSHNPRSLWHVRAHGQVVASQSGAAVHLNFSSGFSGRPPFLAAPFVALLVLGNLLATPTPMLIFACALGLSVPVSMLIFEQLDRRRFIAALTRLFSAEISA